MKINIAKGEIKFLYTESLDLSDIGTKIIKRASYVEPEGNKWVVDLSPITNKDMKIYGFKTRTEAIQHEINYIENNIL